MRRPSDLSIYFKAIADALEISFVYGASERILNRQSSNLEYPVLWLEKPSMSRETGGGYRAKFQSAFVVLISCPVDDYEAEDAAQDLAWELTEKILNRMAIEADEAPPMFEFDVRDSSSDIVERWSGDNDTGWRTEFMLVSSYCQTDDYWDTANWGGVGMFWQGSG
jgi:hypothetical protein